jgi:hypothetical protein
MLVGAFSSLSDGCAPTEPDDAKLESGETRWYDAPKQWSASRITAYLDGPRDNEIEKVEMTFVDQPEGVILNYNLTYVDWVGLPVEIEGLGDGGDCKPAGCYAPRSDVLSGCPAGLLDGSKCRSLGGYCMNAAHQGEAICTKLDGEVERCAQTKPGCEGAVVQRAWISVANWRQDLSAEWVT